MFSRANPVVSGTENFKHLIMVQGDNQSAMVATTVSTNPAVRVVDAFGASR